MLIHFFSGNSRQSSAVFTKVNPRSSQGLIAFLGNIPKSQDKFEVVSQKLPKQPEGFLIKIISDSDEYQAICKQFNKYYIYTNEYRRLLPKARTGEAYSCNVGVIMDLSKSWLKMTLGTLFHLNPNDKIEEVGQVMEQILQEDAATLREKNKNGPLGAFLTGGRRQAYSPPSAILKARLTDIFHKCGIPQFSILWGQDEGIVTTDVCMDAKHKTLYVFPAERSKGDSSTLEELSQHYQQIYLAPGDVLETADGKRYMNLDIVDGISRRTIFSI